MGKVNGHAVADRHSLVIGGNSRVIVERQVSGTRKMMLYKVSQPRKNMRFEPSKFWHTTDWKRSSQNPKPGYVEDVVLYAAGFDEISIHLLPKVRRLRVWIKPETTAHLSDMGFQWGAECRALIFAAVDCREMVANFCPTIFTFEDDGFEPLPTNEFIAREAKTAASCETVTMREAIARWSIEIKYVDDLDGIRAEIQRRNMLYSEQA